MTKEVIRWKDDRTCNLDDEIEEVQKGEPFDWMHVTDDKGLHVHIHSSDRFSNYGRELSAKDKQFIEELQEEFSDE